MGPELKYRDRLLRHLAGNAYEPAPIVQLIEELRVDDPEGFREALRAFKDDGLVAISDDGKVSLPTLPKEGECEGVFRANPRGFGFVQTEMKTKTGDLFVPPHATMGALSGDRVLVEFWMERPGGRRGGGGAGGDDGPRYTAEVVEILKRRKTTFTGEAFKQGKQWLAEPDGKGFDKPIVLRDADAKNVRIGDKVTIEIIDYPDGNQLAEGVVMKVLGEAGDPSVETQSVIAAHDLPSNDFPESCVDQAREITRQFDEQVARFEREGPSACPDRLDITGMFPDESGPGEYVCTIDPPDAKDYDDAIHIKKTDQGWELGVHIADVGHFIDLGTDLDKEAYERGNSVYLPRLVIPMLPEILSNGICSLQEGVTRFSKSVIARYDKNGVCRSEGVASTVIKSKRRLTYLEAQALIDGDIEEAKKHCKTEPVYDDELISALREMDKLAKAIRGRRMRQGMISLDLKEVELVYDEEGRVIDAVEEDDAFTHTLIEMFMVEANEVLGRLFERLHVPLLRRIHPDPTPGDSEHVERAASVAGYKIPSNPTREEIQGLLEATKGKPAARAVHMAVLRTLTKAEYSPGHIGHFALASTAYAHFTSPIRRYPDLTVHRALKAFLEITNNGQDRPKIDNDDAWRKLGKRLDDDERCLGEADLVTIGRHCTETEQNATNAERELRQFLVLQLLEDKVGEEYGAVVTGVTARGVFVQLDKFLADGLIKVEDLPGDVTRSDKPPRWKMDRRSGALVDANSGRSFAMGHMLKVRIAEVDLAKRTLNVTVADAEGRAGGKKKGVPELKLGGAGGGLGEAEGAGFKQRTGSQKRSQRSRSRDKGKTDYRRDKKNKGKR